jgi:hypothetical protein
MARGTFFVWGAALMIDRSVPMAWWVAAGAALVWLFAAPGSVPSAWVVAPSYICFSGALVWAAVTIGGNPRFPVLERHFAAWPMAIYGLLAAGFPWSTTVLAALSPAFYLISAVCQVAFLLGILLLHFRSADDQLQARHRRLSEALQRALSGYLEICPQCQSVLEPTGEWRPLEVHVSRRSGARFSHGICPSCFERYYDTLMV